jgi:hypothetical protein
MLSKYLHIYVLLKEEADRLFWAHWKWSFKKKKKKKKVYGYRRIVCAPDHRLALDYEPGAAH